MATKQDAEETVEQVMEEEEKAGLIPESMAEASTKVEEEQPGFEQLEEVEAREVTSVVDDQQVSVIADEKNEEVAEERSVAEEPKETVEEAPVKEAEEESPPKPDAASEQTQDQGDSAGDAAVAKDEETASETVQERGVDAAAEPEEDQTKEEIPVKPVKQSNNLISKVKSSLVKAKKAIIGKSPPKSDAAETKE